MRRLELEQRSFGGHRGCGMNRRGAVQQRRVEAVFRRSPHRGVGECGESQKSRNERLPGDVEFHNGNFPRCKISEKSRNIF